MASALSGISPTSAGPRTFGKGGFTASNLVRLAQRVALQTRDSSRRDRARNAQMIEDTTRRSADSRRSAIGCQRIRLSGRGYAVIQ
jgi:hypothetical protein